MSTSRFIAWSTWIAASIFYAYQYILRVMPNVMLGDIMQQFHIDAATFGQFSGVYYIGYSLMHLPIGIMLDQYGPRKVMTGCIGLTVIGLLPIIFTDNWVYPIIGRILIGIGSSAAILGAFKIIRMTFIEGLFTRMLSFSVTIGLIGAIYGGGPLSYMCTHFGYQTVVKILAFMGLILAAITYFIVPDISKTRRGSVMSDIKKVLGNHRVICTCIFAGLMVGPLEGFADVWGTEFFKQVYKLDPNIASSLPSTIFIGMCFGAPVLNLIAEKTKQYLGTIAAAGIIMTISFFTLLIWHLSTGVIGFSFLVVGVCCAYQILAIYKASTYVPEHVAGLTTALANMIIMMFGYAFHTIIGSVIHIMGGTNSSQAFVYGVMVVPFALTLGVIGFIILFIKEQRQQTV